MERNALLAVVISLLILVVWNEFVIKQYTPQVQPGSEQAEGSPPAERVNEGELAAPAAAAPIAAAPLAAPAAGAAAHDAIAVDTGPEITIETDLFRAVFTTIGGRLKSLQLTDYKEHIGAGSPAQELINTATGAPLPFGVLLRGEQNTLDDAAIAYQVDRNKLQIHGDQSGTLTFTGKSGPTTIQKTISLIGNRYLWSAHIDVDNPPDFATELDLTWSSVLSEVADQSMAAPGDSPYANILTLESDSLETRSHADTVVDTVRIAGSEPRRGASFSGPIQWIGFSGQYFFSGMVADGAPDEKNAAWAGTTERGTQTMLRFLGQTQSANVAIYTGPKDISLLEGSGHSLRRALDLGWFTVVALPLLRLIRFFNRFTGNYGIDIIILTVLIKVLFYPLTQKSFKSMKAMQKLQPQMERLKELHKDKPEQMNQAVLELYRKEGVNPLGGCLPMFLQLPVFIGLYNALRSAVELRHAPFFGWIQDLSAPDRLGNLQLPFVTGAGIPILTLVMGASMLVQQKMTPTTTADPMQQRMMMLMPVVFTFMFINFPAGLTLYWLVNNILTIGQQYLINRQED